MAVRRALEPFVDQPRPTHAGLWMDRYVRSCLREDTEAKRNLVRQVCETPEPEGYKRFFETWKGSLEASGAWLREGKVVSRMVVGLGAESLLETSITLHRTYGVPYIPGSAIKGTVASLARNRLDDADWQRDGRAYQALFGTQEQAGCVIFHDALYKPGSGHERSALCPDVLTVHHPDYYQRGDAPPADWDSPTPVPFITATGSYVFALEGPEEWVRAAWAMLEHALEQEGVGGKTSRGYGRLKLEPLREPARPTQAGAPAGGVAPSGPAPREVTEVERLPKNMVVNSINQYVERVRRLTAKEARTADDDRLRTALAQAIVAKVDACAPNLRAKPWYAEMKGVE